MQNDETTSARSLKPFCRSSVFIQRFAFVLLALLALVVRLPQLAERPMHTDEAVNGYILGEILDGQSYQYDPQDKHGPFLFALATPVARLCGAKHFADLTETQLRLTPAIFSALAILLFGTGVRVFGFIPCVVGAILFAIAPISVYYGRYFIHETLFVAATLGLLIFGWRMLRDNSLTAAALTGLFAAIALASKETVVINFMALAFTGGAMLLVRRMERKTFAAAGQASRLSPTSLESSDLRHARRLSYAVATGVFAVATILLFTWGGRHWQALADLFRAVPLFTARAGGQGHEKAFQYYFTLLGDGWSGVSVLLLAAIGCWRVWKIRQHLWLVIYTAGVFLIYSVIPYKTPWLALNLLLPVSILAGFAMEWVWNSTSGRVARSSVLIGCAVILGLLALDTNRRAFNASASENNPYAYAHTIPDVLRLPGVVRFHADKLGLANPVIAIVAEDPWPLPWYLRQFQNVGFWQPGQRVGAADFYVTTTELPSDIAEAVQRHRPDFFGVRPNVLFMLWSPTEPPRTP